MPTKVAALILSLLFFGIYFIASSFSYSHRFKNRYSIKNMFPFEFNYEGTFRMNFYGNSAMILTIFATVAFFIFYDQSFTNGFFIAILFIGILASICMGVLSFLPMKLYRLHFVFVTLLFGAVLALSSLITIACFRNWQNLDYKTSFIAFVLGAITTLFTFIMIMNPKITKPVKGVEVEQEDGTKIMKRPPIIHLAFSEWLLFFIFLIDMIALLIEAMHL